MANNIEIARDHYWLNPGSLRAGATFFGSVTLLSAAGVVQLVTQPSNSSGGVPFVAPPYGDEAGDQADIAAGIGGGC